MMMCGDLGQAYMCAVYNDGYERNHDQWIPTLRVIGLMPFVEHSAVQFSKWSEKVTSSEMSSLCHLFALSSILLVFIATFPQLADAECERIDYCNCRRGVDRFGCPLCLCPPCNLCCKYGEFDTMVYFKNVKAWCPNDCYVPNSGIVIDPYRQSCPYPFF